ncbi:MAG TPA: amidohydrolase [Balneolales bacterium]|nr:amidohydrolase [Balneolales bacterium]
MHLIYNIKGYTLRSNSLARFDAMALKNGKVVEIGSIGELERKYSGADKIDGNGYVLLPGLIDAHGHVSGLGYALLDVDLTGARSVEEAVTRVREYGNQYPDLPWIRGRGWNQELWTEGAFPTAEDLDAVMSDRPVWLSRVDSHAGWANSAALEKAGITADTPDPHRGKILRDGNGNPTGVLIDAAMNLIENIIPKRSEAEDELALEKALQRLREVGLTAVTDPGIMKSNWELYEKFAAEGRITTRINAMILGTDADFDSLSANGPVISKFDDLIALRSVKLFEDGALGSRGAALLEPYSDDPDNSGILFHDQESLNAMVLKAAGKGYQVNVHAIGDRANRTVLNAFEKAFNEFGDQGLRNRIEHAQIVDPLDIPRFKKLKVIASMQPTHATSDMNMAEQRIGKDRMEGAYAWQTFLKQGTVVAGGSDFPVESANPFWGLYAAVSRMDHSGNPAGGWYPEEKLTRLQAFRAFTLDAAYAAHQEKVTGSLEPGKWADFILVDTDYFEAPVDHIWKTKVIQTWLAGKKVFDSNGNMEIGG